MADEKMRDIRAMNRTLDHIATDVQAEVKSLKQEDALGQLWDESDELERLLADYPTVTVVGGNIGLGKSNTARILSKFGKVPKLLEPVKENPLLRHYYGNMRRFAPMLQVHVINDRLAALAYEKQRNQGASFVSDRTAYEDPWIFCEVLCAAGLMAPKVKDVCQQYFHERKAELEKRYGITLTPDLVILLTQDDIEVGWKRIKERGREMEVREDAKKGKGLTREFYTTLHRQYTNHFLADLERHYGGSVLRLPQDQVDVSDANNSRGILYVVKSVKEALKVLHGFSA